MINGHSASWQGAAQYLVYDFTPALESATRGEFFDDKDGARTNGEAQTLWEITQTLSYKIPEVTGLIARLEYRHDNSSENCSPTTTRSIRRPVRISICGTGRIRWLPISFTPSNSARS